MTHIDSLPAEILSYTFSALFDGIKAGSITGRDLCRPPDLVNILLVCSHWNRVATLTPYLWSYIPVTNKNGIGIERMIHLLRKDLLRSKECPLDIVITLQPGPSWRAKVEESESSLLLEEITRHGHRWRTLLVRALTPKALEVLEQVYLPRLHSVSYVRYSSFAGFSLKLHAPHLKKLFASSTSLSFGDPLPTLTHLYYNLFSNSTQEFPEHLRRSQHTLTNLHLRCFLQPGMQLGLHSDGTIQGSSGSLNLSFPALTEYSVTFDGNVWNWSPFNIGYFPHLRNLAIHWSSFKDNPSENTISFMPQLITLDISAGHPNSFANAAATLLAAAPNLERLRLSQISGNRLTNQDGWLRPLLCGEEDPEPVPCPRLVVLRLCRITIPRWEDLLRVGSRRPAFKTLSVDSDCWRDSRGEDQDLTALSQRFDIVVEDTEEFRKQVKK